MPQNLKHESGWCSFPFLHSFLLLLAFILNRIWGIPKSPFTASWKKPLGFLEILSICSGFLLGIPWRYLLSKPYFETNDNWQFIINPFLKNIPRTHDMSKKTATESLKALLFLFHFSFHVVWKSFSILDPLLLCLSPKPFLYWSSKRQSWSLSLSLYSLLYFWFFCKWYKKRKFHHFGSVCLANFRNKTLFHLNELQMNKKKRKTNRFVKIANTHSELNKCKIRLQFDITFQLICNCFAVN